MKMAIALIIPAILLACGCSTAKMQVGRPIKFEEVKKIEPGKTSKLDILKNFGPPAAVTINSAGIESYMFVEAAADNHTWILPPLLIIYVDGVASTVGKMLVVNFSGEVVANYGYTVNSTMGAGEAGNTAGYSGAVLPSGN